MKGLHRAVKMGVENRRETDVLLERGRDLASQMVLLEERFEAVEKRLLAEQKKLKEVQREAEKSRSELTAKLQRQIASQFRAEEECKRLESENKRLCSQLLVSDESLTAAQSAHSALERRLVETTSRLHQLESIITVHQPHDPARDVESALRRLEEAEKEKAEMRETLKRRELEHKNVESQLLMQIESLNDGLATSQEQCNQLSSLSSRLQTEIFEMRHSSSDSSSATHQNDILNQRLLSHYRYLVTLTEDDDNEDQQAAAAAGDSDNESDSEAWK